MSLKVNIKKQQGSFLLDIAFESIGGITALFGRSGAGKSSLVNIISGLRNPDSGEILLNNRVLFNNKINISPHKRRIGYVFQESRLFPHLTVKQNLFYGHRFTPKDAHYIDFEQIIHLLGIENLLYRRPGRLSGGEKQRVAIGRALLVSPELLLMDEPLASLDAMRKAEILPYIKMLKESLNIAIVYVSHSVEEVLHLADYIVMLEHGQVSHSGFTQQLQNKLSHAKLIHNHQPHTEFPAEILSHDQENELTTLEFAGGFLSLPLIDKNIGQEVNLRIDACEVILAKEKIIAIGLENQFAAMIETIKNISENILEITLSIHGLYILARVHRKIIEQLHLEEKSDCYVLFKNIQEM